MLKLMILFPVVFFSCSSLAGGTPMAAQGAERRIYEVSLPEGWEKYVSAGRFIVVGEPFYCPTKHFGICPQVQIRWSLENLTAEPLYIKVNYRSPNPDGRGGTGYGVGYLLQPHEARAVFNSVPVFSAIRPVSLQVNLVELRLPERHLLVSAPHRALTTKNLTVSPSAVGDFRVPDENSQRSQVAQIQLASSKEQPYVLEISLNNPTEKDCRFRVQTSVGNPSKIDAGQKGISPLARSKGSFAETEVKVRSRESEIIQVPYRIPSDAGRKPLLGYRVFEVPGWISNKMAEAVGLTDEHSDLLFRGGDLVSAGSVALWSAADKGLVTLPKYVPVEERTQLTAQTRSDHFLFRYRPDSYAAMNIDRIIGEREEAYKKLRIMLQMELPVTVTIDLYPDMEAKGAGSGTKWTPANTVNNKHIAEVYNDSYHCDPGHELAHIFTYHFGGGGDGLCEPFAVYCEANADIPRAMERVKLKLNEGKLGSLPDILWSPDDESKLFIDYLIRLDLTKFKQFYVGTTQSQKRKHLEKTSQEIYGTDLAGLERKWHTQLSQGEQGPQEMVR